MPQKTQAAESITTACWQFDRSNKINQSQMKMWSTNMTE